MNISGEAKKKFSRYAPFDLDGRLMVQPTPEEVLPGTHPVKISNATARTMITMFQRFGLSNHSGHGTTLWALIAWCRAHDKVFEVWKWESHGTVSYSVFLDKIPDAIGREDGEKIL